MLKRKEEDGRITYDVGGEEYELRPPTVRSRKAAMGVFTRYPDVVKVTETGTSRNPEDSERALDFALDLAAAALLKKGQHPKDADPATLKESLVDSVDEDDLEVIVADFFVMLNRGGGSSAETENKEKLPV